MDKVKKSDNSGRFQKCNAGKGKKEVWNEKFRFEVEFKDKEENEDGRMNKLVLSIIDKHQFFPDFPVGETT